MELFYNSKIDENTTNFAISDEDQLIAFPLETIDNKEIYHYIKNIIRKENIEKFVVGLPKNNINNLFSIEKEIKLFIKKIKQEYPFLSIFRVDERFTSTLARLTIAKSQLKKTKHSMKHKKLANMLRNKYMFTLILEVFV